MSRGLNGWQRLWVVVAVVLLPLVVSTIMVKFSTEKMHTDEMVIIGLFLWAGLVGAIYLFGFAVAWVRRGFVSKAP